MGDLTCTKTKQIINTMLQEETSTCAVGKRDREREYSSKREYSSYSSHFRALHFLSGSHILFQSKVLSFPSGGQSYRFTVKSFEKRDSTHGPL